MSGGLSARSRGRPDLPILLEYRTMDETCDNLDALLNSWRAEPLTRDLTAAVMDRARAEDAALDDLLSRFRPAVELQADLVPAVLAKARGEDLALDRLLDEAAIVPPPAGDIGSAVLRTIRRGRLRRRLAVIGSALAAAAAVLVIAVVLHRPMAPATNGPAEPVLTAIEQHMIEQVGLQEYIEDLPVLVHWDMIVTMEQLENEAPATDSLRHNVRSDG